MILHIETEEKKLIEIECEYLDGDWIINMIIEYETGDELDLVLSDADFKKFLVTAKEKSESLYLNEYRKDQEGWN